MSAPTPDEMLNWIAVYVTRISSLNAKRGEKMELEASDGDDSILVTRCGANARQALDRCVIAAMRKLPQD